MKKLTVILIIVMILQITAGAQDFNWSYDFSEKPDSFTEEIADDGHFVKYDEENGDIHAYNSDGSSGQTGKITLENAVSGDIFVSFSFVATENHQRLKMLFMNENGRQLHMHQLYRNARTGVYLTDSKVSQIDSDFPKAEAGERVYVEMTIKTGTKTADYRVGLEENGSVVWSDLKTDKTLEILDETALNLKEIQFKNEYTKCDVHIDDLVIQGGETSSGDDNEDDEPADVNLEYPEDEDSEYDIAFNHKFSDAANIETTGSVNETHYATLNEEKGFAQIKNGDGVGACTLSVVLPEEQTKDFTRAAFTYYVNSEEHQRMKIFVKNSFGQQINLVCVILRDGNVVLSDNSMMLIDNELPKVPVNTPIRLEMEFDFTQSKVRYRIAVLSAGKWQYSEWTAYLPAYKASADTVMDLKSIVFSNEYMLCDVFVDDLRVSVPKPKPAANNVEITGMKTDVPITRDTLTGTYKYYEENGIDEGESVLEWAISDTSDFTQETVVAGNTLVLDESYAGKYIKFRVKPVSVAGIVGRVYESSVIGPVELVVDSGNAPVASELSYSGSAVIGGTITAQYKFSDIDYDDEGDTQISWYADETLVVSGSFKENSAFEVKEEYEGKTIKFVITPVSISENNPTGEPTELVIGVAAKSDAYYDCENLKLTPASGSELSDNIYLPTKGEKGSDIKWESSDAESIAADGSVRQSSRDKEVTLTATVSKDGVSFKKSFTYIVAAKKSVSGGSGTSPSSSVSISAPSATPTPEEPDDEQADEETKELFSDLDGFEWAKTAIETLYSEGVISGVEEGIFAPEKNITRAEFVTMVVKKFNITGDAELKFEDVSTDDWYYSYVSAGVANGLIMGKSDSFFGAGENITKEDMAVIIYRALKIDKTQVQDVFADDADISDYATDAVYTLKERGIISGSEGFFYPKSFARRAEAAVMICNS